MLLLNFKWKLKALSNEIGDNGIFIKRWRFWISQKNPQPL